MSLPGKILYHCWHRPANTLSDLVAAGGPWEVRKTEQGRKQMERAARTLPKQSAPLTQPLELHLLTGSRFWYQSLFCLWTFARQSQCALKPYIYDDGSLEGDMCTVFQHHFSDAHIISSQQTLEKLNQLLPESRYPSLRDRWLYYPNIRKLIDPHVGQKGWKLVIDSDLLFFHRPDFLIYWLEHPSKPLHGIDCETSYGYPRKLLSSLAGHPLREKINVGLTGLESSELDWDRLEYWTRQLLDKNGTNYFLEQALVAMLLSDRDCDIAPEKEYVTLPSKREALTRQAVMHHYVAHAKRYYFQENWKHCLEDFPNSLLPL